LKLLPYDLLGPVDELLHLCPPPLVQSSGRRGLIPATAA
jgi:hypothetical protein